MIPIPFQDLDDELNFFLSYNGENANELMTVNSTHLWIEKSFSPEDRDISHEFTVWAIDSYNETISENFGVHVLNCPPEANLRIEA